MERIRISLYKKEMARGIIFLAKKIGFVVGMWSCVVCLLACKDGMSNMELCTW